MRSRGLHLPPTPTEIGFGHVVGRVAEFRVRFVDAERVRNRIWCDYTMGGNASVYHFVPDGEVWIDGAMSQLDRMATVLHEIVECRLMRHRGWTYNRAHDAATAKERVFRARFDGRDVCLDDVRDTLRTQVAA